MFLCNNKENEGWTLLYKYSKIFMFVSVTGTDFYRWDLRLYPW